MEWAWPESTETSVAVFSLLLFIRAVEIFLVSIFAPSASALGKDLPGFDEVRWLGWKSFGSRIQELPEEFTMVMGLFSPLV